MKQTEADRHERIEVRDLLRELNRRLVGEVKKGSCLRQPPISKEMDRVVAGLDRVVNKLADDPTAGSLVDGMNACPVCDRDPNECERGGDCAFDPDPARRPEPWDAMTTFLPRPEMKTIREAIERARDLAESKSRSDSSALSFVALDFLAHHDFMFPPETCDHALRFLVETFEHEMGFRLVVSDKSGKLLYGRSNLERVVQGEALGHTAAEEQSRP